MVTTHHVDAYSSALVERPGIVSLNDHPASLKRHGAIWYGLPDIDHPATKGWLLHMLREAVGSWDAGTARGPHSPWVVVSSVDDREPSTLGMGPTEGAALAAALLAVWGAS